MSDGYFEVRQKLDGMKYVNFVGKGKKVLLSSVSRRSDKSIKKIVRDMRRIAKTATVEDLT